MVTHPLQRRNRGGSGRVASRRSRATGVLYPRYRKVPARARAVHPRLDVADTALESEARKDIDGAADFADGPDYEIVSNFVIRPLCEITSAGD